MYGERLALLPLRGGDAKTAALLCATLLIAVTYLVTSEVTVGQSTAMLSKAADSNLSPKFTNKLKSMFHSFRSQISSQLHDMETKLEKNIKSKAGSQSDRLGFSHEAANVQELRKRYKSREELKKQNKLMFEWNAALQHQILALCVSSAVADGSVDGSKSVKDIKSDCLHRITKGVEHEMMKTPTTKSS
jgi:hypothetical protein